MRLTNYPTRDAWLEARRGRIGASVAASILGCSPFSGPWSVYRKEVEGHEEKHSASTLEVFDRGHDLELPVVARLRRSDRYDGLEVRAACEGPIFTAENDRRPLFLASPDVAIFDRGELAGGNEIKTVSRADLGYLFDDDEPSPAWVRHLDGMDVLPGDEAGHVPLHWVTQVYITLEITGAPWWDLSIFGPHIDQLATLRIYRDAEFQAALADRCEAWWQRHIIGGEPPEIDESDDCYAWLRATWPEEARGAEVVALPDEIDEIAAAYVADRQAVTDAEARKRKGRSLLVVALRAAGSDSGRTTNHTIKLSKGNALLVKERK